MIKHFIGKHYKLRLGVVDKVTYSLSKREKRLARGRYAYKITAKQLNHILDSQNPLEEAKNLWWQYEARLTYIAHPRDDNAIPSIPKYRPELVASYALQAVNLPDIVYNDLQVMLLDPQTLIGCAYDTNVITVCNANFDLLYILCYNYTEYIVLYKEYEIALRFKKC